MSQQELNAFTVLAEHAVNTECSVAFESSFESESSEELLDDPIELWGLDEEEEEGGRWPVVSGRWRVVSTDHRPPTTIFSLLCWSRIPARDWRQDRIEQRFLVRLICRLRFRLFGLFLIQRKTRYNPANLERVE